MTRTRNPIKSSGNISLRKTMLTCGILSSLWYLAINIYVPMQYEGYSLSSLTVSELSAIGAPTRSLWITLVIFYPLLFATFGWGVIQSATGHVPGEKRNRPLYVVGYIILGYCVFNLYWPPMHQRGHEPTLTDTLHIAWAIVTVLLMMTMMGLGAAALGRRFRIYTIVSIVIHITFGILTVLESPNIPTNGPTPWIGVWERINIGVFMLWVVVLALSLLQKEKNGILDSFRDKFENWTSGVDQHI